MERRAFATPRIWLASSGREPAQVRRLARTLIEEGLEAERQLTLADLDRHTDRVPSRHPDVLVTACDLVRRDYRALDRIGRRMPYTHHVIVSAVHNPVAVRRALDMGVSGLVDERRLEQTLVAAIRAVSVGLLALPPETRSSAEKPILTHREKQTLALIVDGLTNGEIARTLGLSENTVKSHLSSSFAKLGVHSRSEAAALILDPESGLGPTALPPRRRSARPSLNLTW